MLRRIIDRPVAVTMLLLSLVVVGIVCAVRLPVALIPDVRIPQITVQVDAPQMSARQIDESAVRTLRSQLVQIDGLKDITCLSRDGSATLRLTLDHGDDIDYRFIEVNEKIDRAMGSMPNIGRPKVLKASATDIPAFYLNLTSREGGDFLSLSRFAQDVVVRRLEQLDAVAMVDVSGVEESRIMVIPDEARLRQAGLTYDDVARLVSQADVRLGSLTIRDGQYRYPVRFQSMAGSADDIASLWLNHDGHLLQLRDIASIREEVAPRAGMLSSDGHPAVSLAVISQRDARMSDLRKGVSALMDDFVREYPQVSFTLTRDQTALLDYSISNLLQNLLVGILLACLFIYLFLRDFRSPVLVAVTIPVSLVLSMLVFKVLGMTLNIVSLSGLLLGVGMMTDNSLVLIDNITATQGEDAAWQYLADLDANIKNYYNSGSMMYSALGKGDADISWAVLSDIVTNRDTNGLPFEIIDAASGSVVLTDCIAAIKDAPHPNAAAAFVEFAGSKEIQTLLANEFSRTPTLSSALPDCPEWMQTEYAALPVDWANISANQLDWLEKWETNIINTDKNVAKD